MSSRFAPRSLCIPLVALVATLVLAGCQPQHSAPSAPAGARVDPFTGASAHPRLAELNWLVGTWRGTGLGGEVEEIVLPPVGNSMPVVFRAVRDGQVTFHEFVLVEAEDDGVVMRLHHFSPQLKRWEDEPVTFDLVRSAPNEALFRMRNAPEEQTELLYRRNGPRLRAELSKLREGERAVVATFAYRLAD
jgi:hypothetical protein